MVALLAKALAIAVVINAPCPGFTDKPNCAMRPNIVYRDIATMRDEGWSAEDRRYELHHELGHIVDYNFLRDSDRGMFEALTHQAGRPWRDPPNSPNEQFAEAVALCAQSMRKPPELGGAYGYAPSPFEHRKVCKWLASLA